MTTETLVEFMNERRDFFYIYATPTVGGEGWDVVLRIDGTYSDFHLAAACAEGLRARLSQVEYLAQSGRTWWNGPPWLGNEVDDDETGGSESASGVAPTEATAGSGADPRPSDRDWNPAVLDAIRESKPGDDIVVGDEVRVVPMTSQAKYERLSEIRSWYALKVARPANTEGRNQAEWVLSRTGHVAIYQQTLDDYGFLLRLIDESGDWK